MKIKTADEVRELIDNMSLNEYRGHTEEEATPKRILQMRYKDIFHLYCIIYINILDPKLLENQFHKTVCMLKEQSDNNKYIKKIL